MERKAVFLDLFGSIIEDHGVLEQADKLRFKNGALKALKALDAAGYLLFVSVCRTGQPVPEPGYVEALQQRIRKAAAAAHLPPDKLHFLSKVEGAEPDVQPLSAERLLTLAITHDLQLSQCIVAGDLMRDVKVGHAVGAKTVLLSSPDDTPVEDDADWDEPEFVVSDLAEAVDRIMHPAGASAN